MPVSVKNNCDVFGYRYRRPAIVTIYLIKICGTRTYKIGYTSQHIKDRMRLLKFQHGNIELIDTVESGFSLEKRLHEKFESQKVNNGYREFFTLSEEDVNFVINLFTSIRNG